MADPFGSFADSVVAPSRKFVPVTPQDVDLPDGTCKALLVGGAGTANLMDATGGVRANVPLQQGYNPIRCLRVISLGTATNIWALY